MVCEWLLIIINNNLGFLFEVILFLFRFQNKVYFLNLDLIKQNSLSGMW